MEAIIGILGPVIEVGKCVGGPIKRHLNYLFCFNNNIQSLREEARKLKDANDGLKTRVDAAKNNIEVIYPVVETWLETASQSNDIINGIENDFPKVQRACMNLISRYSLSRKAAKTAEEIRELLTNCKFDQISQAAPPAAMESIPLGPKEKFETRKKIEEDVMEALKDGNVNIIGLCGMGGIGKTTMAERIMNRVKDENLFNEVVMVVASQQVDIPKLQQSIADQFNVALEVGDLRTREYKIRQRITKSTKKILLVIDDVWEFLHLKDLGIPSGRCTVLLISRDRNVLDRMETQRIFGIEILPEEEAWLLFRKKTGNCVDGEDLHSIAKEVAKECKGLPVALVTVGGALRNKTSRQLWANTLSQLKSSKPDDLPGMLVDVYKPLRLSFDCLATERLRSIFLICSLFKEDFDIDLETLTRYGLGLDILEEHGNFNEARNNTHALIERLKDRSLLLDGSDEHHVKMHDVVRDMAIYIAPKEQPGGLVINLTNWASRENYYEDCNWISITNFSTKMKFPMQLKCPRLRLLMMQGDYTYEYSYEMRLPDSFFDGMQEIRVLFMEQIRMSSLPPTTKLLKNLKTLHLYECPNLETISVVGELLKLEILSCDSCHSIRALPIEIGRLSGLRLLEIISCQNLTRIVPGVISNLVSLQELKLRDFFGKWEAKESNAKENFAFAELESLTELTCLEIQIDDVKLAAEEICLPSKIVKYSIVISARPDSFSFDFPMIYMDIPKEITVGNWIKTLVRRTEWLELRGDGANQLVHLVEHEKIKSLTVRSCSLVKLVNTTIKTSVFPSLESLVVTAIDTLEEIIPVRYCYTNHYPCFKNLKRICIIGCPRLKYLFPMCVAIEGLAQLEHLEVYNCQAIEDIFCNDHDKMGKDEKFNGHNLPRALFPKLKHLDLELLPRLKAQETLNKIVASHNLEWLQVERLKDDVINNTWCLCSPFYNLVYISITNFNGIKNLMSPAFARNLVQLKSLAIQSCEMMLAVIADDDEVQVTDQITLFPCLDYLFMGSLPNLRSFCQWNHLELPSLSTVRFEDCPLVETFSRGSLSTPKLKSIELNSRYIGIATTDLNKAIQQCWMHGSGTKIEA